MSAGLVLLLVTCSALAQTVSIGPLLDSTDAIEPPPWTGGPPPLIVIAPDDPPPLVSYLDPPASEVALDDPEPLELPPPPTVVIQQLPPIIMTRTCTRDNYYSHGKKYYHGKTHCSEPQPDEAQTQ